MKVKLNAQQMTVAVWIGVGALGLGVAYVAYKSLANFNKGTPFEGTGAIGTLGNVTNQVLGGAPQAAGEAISEALFNLTHADMNSLNFTFKFKADPSIGGQVAADLVDEDTGEFVFVSYLPTSKKFDGKRFRLKKTKDGRKFAEGPL